MTLAPRWRKALRDLEAQPFRTVLAVLAMAAGVFGITAILTARSVLSRELAKTYAATRPASAILVVRGADPSIAAFARRVPGVADAEARPVVFARFRADAEAWVPAVLFVVPDFDDVRIDRFARNAGGWPPRENEVLLERTALTVARAKIGDLVDVRTTSLPPRPTRIAGTVHAAGLAPSWMEHSVSGFVGWRSPLRADTAAQSSQLRIVVEGDRLDERHVRAVADRVRAELERGGHAVTRIDVPSPGRHPHADQMDTFLFLLGAFGALAFVLGSLLLANLVQALLAEQTRQVGIMKAVGGTTRQVSGIYLGQISILAVASLGVGMPLGYAVGIGYAQFMTTMLNATLASVVPPAWALVVPAAAGIGVPLLVAIAPVRGAARISVHEALGAGLARRPFGTRPFDRWLGRLAFLPRPLMLSLRATFHQGGRLMLTVGTLALGGAGFISSLNVQGAWTHALDGDGRARRYDLHVQLAEPTSKARLDAALTGLSTVAHAEYWAGGAATMAAAGGGESRMSLVGPDEGSALLALPQVAGRWLRPGDRDVAVINQAVVARDPTLHVGGTVRLHVGNRDVAWPIVGFVKELAPHPNVYAPRRAVLEATGQSDTLARTARIVTLGHGPAAEIAAAAQIERALQKGGIGVALIQRLSDNRQALADHLVIIRNALLLATALVLVVGALGLTSTLTLDVLRRTREIGVLGAIGARPATIARHVAFEGALIGFLSWVVALPLALPISYALEVVSGRMFFRAPLDFFASPRPAAMWLALVLVLAWLCSLHPARRATRLTIREALAYE